jgi:hypothetical protein
MQIKLMFIYTIKRGNFSFLILSLSFFAINLIFLEAFEQFGQSDEN